MTHIENGFDFLGQNVRTYNSTLLIKPSKKHVTSFEALTPLSTLTSAPRTLPETNDGGDWQWGLLILGGVLLAHGLALRRRHRSA